MPQQHMYMVISLKQAVAAAHQATCDDSSFEKTGETKNILGYTCAKCLAKSKDGSVTEIWAAEGLGLFMGLGGSNPLRPSQPKPWEKEMMDQGFFPLLVIGHSPSGDETFRLETTSVEKQTLPDSTFSIPAGFRRFDLPNMMGGMNPFGHQ